jgi:hypothetical protein
MPETVTIPYCGIVPRITGALPAELRIVNVTESAL